MIFTICEEEHHNIFSKRNHSTKYLRSGGHNEQSRLIRIRRIVVMGRCVRHGGSVDDAVIPLMIGLIFIQQRDFVYVRRILRT